MSAAKKRAKTTAKKRAKTSRANLAGTNKKIARSKSVAKKSAAKKTNSNKAGRKTAESKKKSSAKKTTAKKASAKKKNANRTNAKKASAKRASAKKPDNQNKTVQKTESPARYIASVEHKVRQRDAKVLLKWFTDVTGLKPRMWGSIIGYGRYYYKYESGRSGECMITGFSPRAASMSIYIMPGYRDMSDKLARLGKHKIGKSCLYITNLDNVDMDVLAEMVSDGVDYMRANYKTWDV